MLEIFLIRDVEDTFNPTHLMGCWESNPIQPCFLCRQVVYLHVIHPLGGGVACKYILYTGIRNLAGGEFRTFLSIPRIVVRDTYYYSQYLFIYLFILYIYIFIYLYIYINILLIVFYDQQKNKIYVVRKHFAVFIFNKYLVLEFWFR